VVGQLGQRVRVQVVERGGHAPVQHREAGAGERVEQRRADDGVHEPVPQVPARHLDDEPGGERLLHRREQLLLAELARGGHQRELERHADHRGQAQHPERGLRQPREPPSDHLAHPVRDAELGAGFGGPAVAAAHDPARLGEVAQQLADEERVASGLGVDGAREPPVGGAECVARGRGHVRGDGGLVEPGEVQPRHAGLAAQVGEQLAERVVAGQLVVPVGGDDQQLPRPGRPGDVAEQLEGGGGGPLEVVEHEQQRALGRRGDEPLGDGVEQAVALGLRVRADGWRQAGQAGRDLRHEPDELARAGAQPAGPAPQRLDERLVRHDQVLVAAPDQHGTAVGVHGPGELGGQAGLADARLPRDEGQPRTVRARGAPQRVELGQLVGAPDEHPAHLGEQRRQRRHTGVPIGRVEGRVLAQDRDVQLGQRGAGRDAQLGVEPGAQLTVDLQRLGLPSAAVERQHALAPHPLAGGVRGGEAVQFADEVGVAAHDEVGVDPVLQRRQPRLLQLRRRAARGGGVEQVVEHGPPPQREGGAQRVGGLGRRPGGELRPPLGVQPGEAGGIEVGVVDLQHVPGRPGDEPPVGARRPQRAAEAGHVHPQRVGGALRHPVAPESLGQPLGRDGLVRVEQEQREQHALAHAAEVERHARRVEHLERAEYAELHRSPPV
jgi:hypothetical protein